MIKKLEIDGYRLLDGFEADLGRLTVVIGANATGKSTLLDCLQLISQCASYPVNEALLWHGGALSVLTARRHARTFGWRVTFERSDIMAWALLPVRGGLDLVYEAKLDVDSSWGVAPSYEALRYAQPFPGHDRHFMFFESRPGRRRIFDVDRKQLVDVPSVAEEAPSREPQAETGFLELKSKGEAPGTAPKGPSLLLCEARLFGKYPVASELRVLFASFALYPGFRVEPGAPARQPSQISPLAVLLPSGDNVASVLHEIFTRADFRSSAEEVRGFLRVAYPYVEEVTAETSWMALGGVAVRVRERGLRRAMDAWGLSDGMIRFLSLEAALLNPVAPGFVGIDEPEAGLHPRLMPVVADMIKAGAERTQVLVTTHSPELLGHFDLEHIAVMTRDEGQARWFRPSSRQSLREMLKAVGGDTVADLHRSGELEAMS